MLCELIGEPIKHSAKLIREPINGRVKTGTLQSTEDPPLGVSPSVLSCGVPYSWEPSFVSRFAAV